MNMEMKKGFTKKNGQYFRVTKEDFKAIGSRGLVFLLSTQIRQTIQQHIFCEIDEHGKSRRKGSLKRMASISGNVTKEVMVTWRSHPHR